MHDSRFIRVSLSHAAPGDIVVQSGLNPDGYAGIVVDNERIIGGGGREKQNNSNLAEIEHRVPPVSLFRYIGVQKSPGYTLALMANVGFDPNEPRVPAGQSGGGQWTTAPSTVMLSGGDNRVLAASKPASQPNKQGEANVTGLTDAQSKLLQQKNAEAAAIIAEYGDKGETPDTPQSILNGPLKSVRGSNLGWMPGTPNWDLRQKYPGYSPEDVALMEAARRNGVRAAVLLAHAGLLPKSQVTALQLKGMGVLADASLNLALVLAPYESIAGLGSKAILGTTETAAGSAASELANPSESLAAKVSSNPSHPNYNAIEWVPEPTTMMKPGAADYQATAPASRYAMAPRLSATDSSGTITAKFDGVDANTGEMVDRKTNVARTTDFTQGALRQSTVAAKNGFKVRWEVPNAAVQAQAQRIISTNGIKNIRVVVRPEWH